MPACMPAVQLLSQMMIAEFITRPICEWAIYFVLKTAFTEFTFQHKNTESSDGGIATAEGYIPPDQQEVLNG